MTRASHPRIPPQDRQHIAGNHREQLVRASRHVLLKQCQGGLVRMDIGFVKDSAVRLRQRSQHVTVLGLHRLCRLQAYPCRNLWETLI
jgi:hypothetical protein